MKYQIDTEYLFRCFQDLVNVPSPVGYYKRLNPIIEKIAAEFGKTVTYDNKSTAYITLDGEDNSKTVLIGAHADTIGMTVRKIEANGMIRVRALGGVVYSSLEGETVYICTRSGEIYSGLMMCQSHSPHAFAGMRDVPRDENTMQILLDKPIQSKDDVLALGIQPGDYVSAEPHFCINADGIVKSRYIDDKGPMACTFAMLKYLCENNLKPKYRTLLAFPYAEEIGVGGAYVPPEVSEYVAIDIALIGPDSGTDDGIVVICSRDSTGPYDYELTDRLLDYAKKAECDYALEVFFGYGTDAGTALKAGNNLRGAAFGMPVWCSHGMERSNIKGFINTTNLMLAYVLDLQ